MKKSRVFTILIYVAVLVLAFSWMLGLFSGDGEDLSYSQVVKFFNNEQVKSFVVKENTIYLTLHSEYKGKFALTAPMADPEGFHTEMRDLLKSQTEAGILESYDFVPEEKQSPYAYIVPIVLAGIILLILWFLLVGRANSNNPMNNFGKARTVNGLPGNRKVTFEDVAGVVDKFTAVDMAAAVSADELAESLSHTASSAYLAGIDINKIILYNFQSLQ